MPEIKTHKIDNVSFPISLIYLGSKVNDNPFNPTYLFSCDFFVIITHPQTVFIMCVRTMSSWVRINNLPFFILNAFTYLYNWIWKVMIGWYKLWYRQYLSTEFNDLVICQISILFGARSFLSGTIGWTSDLMSIRIYELVWSTICWYTKNKLITTCTLFNVKFDGSILQNKWFPIKHNTSYLSIIRINRLHTNCTEM